MVGMDLIQATVSCVCLASVLLVGSINAEVSIKMSLDPPSLREPLTPVVNVTVRCWVTHSPTDGTNTSSPGSNFLSRLRVLIATGESSLKPLAQLTFTDPDRVYQSRDVTLYNVTGSINPVITSNDSHSRIDLTWQGPTELAVRRFRCDAAVHDRKSPQSMQYKFTESSVGADNLSGASWALAVAAEKETLSALTEDLSVDINGAVTLMEQLASQKTVVVDSFLQVSSLLNKLVNSSESEELSAFTSELNNHAVETQNERIAKFKSLLERAFASSYFLMWPKGQYGLQKAASGCPSDTVVAWKTGLRKQHTESSSSNRDSVSNGNHLEKPVLFKQYGKNFVYQRFCIKMNDNERSRPDWPRGSYCINRVGGSCPNGFQNGAIRWDEEDSGFSGTSEGRLPDGEGSVPNKLFYCCRLDGPAEQPISLPVTHPFYLYRRGGQCQKVAGMEVREEYIYFDTENSSNNDQLSGQHPDANTNNLRLYLCYYE